MDDEERYGAGLRELMLTVDVPPPRADVSSAVRVGRRRHQTRTVGIAAASVLVVAVGVVGYATTGPRRAGPDPVGVAPSGKAEAQRCPVSVLETIPGTRYRVVATDPTGRYFVGYHEVGQQISVVLWTDGKPQDLGIDGTPVAVNAKGVIAGYFGQDDTARAFVYREGHTTQLPRPSGYAGSMPTGINARGDIVGYAMKGALDVNLALFWSVDQPDKVTTLTTPSGIGHKSVSSLRASGINDDRIIIGWIREAPVYWSPDGAVHQLPLPSGWDSGNPMHVRGRYAYGTLGKTGDSREPAVRWDLGAGGQPTVVAEASHRIVDGTPTGWTLVSDPETTNQLIDPAGAVIPLPAPDRATVVVAWSISDDAKTIVGTVGESGETHVVWHC